VDFLQVQYQCVSWLHVLIYELSNGGKTNVSNAGQKSNFAKDHVSNFALNHHKKIPHHFQYFNPLKS
jgi:hypothetical protein